MNDNVTNKNTSKILMEKLTPETQKVDYQICYETNFTDRETEELHEMLFYLRNSFITPRKCLQTVKSVDDVIKQIKKANNIVVITGAGISRSVGIPDFRSSDGFYSLMRKEGFLEPEELFDLNFFKDDPLIFYSVSDKLIPKTKNFSILHSFIRILQEKKKLLRNYTQNVDNLEEHAGIHTDKLVQCHGSFKTFTCMVCHKKVKLEKVRKKIERKEVPHCRECFKKIKTFDKMKQDQLKAKYGVLKPDIVFFGESLNNDFHENLENDILKCDLVFCIGTSLNVSPVANIIKRFHETVPQILINQHTVKQNFFDVNLLGNCDDVALYIMSQLEDSWKIPLNDHDPIRNVDFLNLKFDVKTIDLMNREFEILNIKNS